MASVHNARVIVSADDDEDAHLLLRRAFAKAAVPATLIQIDDGSEVVEYLRGEGRFADRTQFPLPDLLLVDLKMRQVSGFEVLEFLAENPQFRQCPVIIFSSSDHPVDVEKAYALGCDSYMVKPSDFAGLLEFVRKLAAEGCQKEVTKTAPSKRGVTALPAMRVREADGAFQPMKSSIDPYQSPEMFALLVEQIKDYAIFVLDREGYIRSWNEGARRIKGYEPAEIIGKHFSAFYPHADKEADKPAFELRMALEMGRYEDEGWRLRKDGSRFWANVILTPLRETTGKITGFAKITRDLTQRKMQEDQFQHLLESEERFRLLVEQVKDYAIFFLDAKGNISSWNQGARRIKGYSADEIIGKHFSTFYTPEDLASDKPTRELSIAIKEGRYEEEGWRVKKDGSRFWASVVITALWDKRGNLTGFAKVTRDLTQRKREEEALRAKNAELETFAHTLSHDLRAPLRSVSSFAQVLIAEGTELDASERETYLQKIYKAASSMEALIRDILKLSEVSLAPAGEQFVSLDEVVAEAIRLLEADIKNTNAQVKVRAPLPILKANRTFVFQIFSNLLANALKFTTPGQSPRVEIFAEHRNGECEIHVKDSGRGIPAHLQRSIFNMFDRGSAGPSYTGTGIGLAIVKKAVERSGGSITVVSTEGEGADFIVTLACQAPVSSPLGSPVSA